MSQISFFFKIAALILFQRADNFGIQPASADKILPAEIDFISKNSYFAILQKSLGNNVNNLSGNPQRK